MRLNKKIVVAAAGILAMFAGQQLYAQQDPMYTMYMWNTLTINPAYAGSREDISAMVLDREQWVSLPGAPSTQAFTIHSPLVFNQVALGLSVVNDKVGPEHNTGFWGDFAYRIKTTGKAKLSMALRAGVKMHTVDLASLQGLDGNDPAFNKNVDNSILPNFGLGFYYYSDRGYLGLSIPHLLQNELNKGNNPTGTSQDLEKRHMYLTGGYVFSLSGDSVGVMFKPSFLIQAVEGGPISFDLTGNFLIKQKLWIGAAYRYQDSWSAILSYQFTPHLRAGYSYDFSTSALSAYNKGSHEFMISYDFFKPEIAAKSPRYF